MGVNNVGYSTMTVTATTKVLASECSPVMPSQTKGALITVETDQVRYREDGTDPTATEGILLNVGDVLTYDSWSVPKLNWRSILLAIKFERVTADAKLKVHWYD